jgi:hypothetical protein
MEDPEEIWNLLHDGSIVDIRGVVPGDVTVRVEIDYLTRIMSPSCEAIDIALLGCHGFEYVNWSDDHRTTDLQVLAQSEPEILSASSTSTGVRVTCTTGQFDIQYADVRLTRQDGMPSSVEEIDAAATAYWNAWRSRHGG